MPFTSDQLALFGIALAMKRGEQPYSYSKAAAEIARTTSEADLKKMISEGEQSKKLKERFPTMKG